LPASVAAAFWLVVRACGAERKTAKAEGKVPTGQRWPQFWSRATSARNRKGCDGPLSLNLTARQASLYVAAEPSLAVIGSHLHLWLRRSSLLSLRETKDGGRYRD
jgi:hypothetical protein